MQLAPTDDRIRAKAQAMRLAIIPKSVWAWRSLDPRTFRDDIQVHIIKVGRGMTYRPNEQPKISKIDFQLSLRGPVQYLVHTRFQNQENSRQGSGQPQKGFIKELRPMSGLSRFRI
jgi:hypothetical protein